MEAGRQAVGRMRQLVRERHTFAVETTLSGRLHLQIAEQAKLESWSVGVIYIGLGSADLAIDLVLILDNSSVRQPMRRILEVRHGTVVFRHRRLPKWVRSVVEAVERAG